MPIRLGAEGGSGEKGVKRDCVGMCGLGTDLAHVSRRNPPVADFGV